MTELWLSRVRLKRDASIATLAPLLLPEQEDSRVSSGHRLMHSLFAADGRNEPRDFLWRDDESGSFYILSKRHPPQDHPLFEIDPPKIFAPALSAGDQLRFSLRANPTVSRPLDSFRTQQRSSDMKKSRKTAHDDVVMDAIKDLDPPKRADARSKAIQSAGRKWLENQGVRCGFSLGLAPDHDDPNAGPDPLRIDGYRVLRPPRARRSSQMRIGVVDFEGVLTVTNPEQFLSALTVGFGRAKAYGCGLMLIARA